MIAAILKESGKTVARSTTQGAWIGEEQVISGDVAGGGTTTMLMQDPAVEAGVFEISRGGLVKKGMRLDSVDIGIILNVYDNHLGLNSINTREEMAKVKSLVVRNARKLTIINADDPLCLDIAKEFSANKLILVSSSSNNSALNSHLASDGVVAYIEKIDSNPILHLKKGTECIGNIEGKELVGSHGGIFRPAMINSLFAMAAGYGLNIDFSIIKHALTNFSSQLKNNTGRNNFYQNLPYSLLISHADGAQALHELVNFVERLEIKGNKTLLLCSVGDRSNTFIQNMANEVAGKFSNYICTNYYKLRGERKAEEVPNLLAKVLLDNGVPKEQIQVELSNKKAINLAYQNIEADDLLVDNLYYSTIDTQWLKQRKLDNKLTLT